MDTPSRSTRRGLVIAAVFFAAVFGGVAWASGANPSATPLGSGVVEADCQTAPISTEWAYGYDAAVPGYGVTGVILDGLEAGCLDKGIRVVLANSAGVQQASGVGLTPPSGTSVLVLLSPGFDLNQPWISQMTIAIHS